MAIGEVERAPVHVHRDDVVAEVEDVAVRYEERRVPSRLERADPVGDSENSRGLERDRRERLVGRQAGSSAGADSILGNFEISEKEKP